MKNQIKTLSIVASAFLTFTSTSSLAGENLIQNGSFEDYTIERDHGRWKLVNFDNWTGNGEAWNSKIGRAATDGEHKIELDVGRELNELSQIVTTVKGKKYKLSLDAYARRNRTSDFQILVDGEVVENISPDRNWAEYAVYFVGTGSQQVISLKELDNQNNGLGTIIDNVKLQESAEMIVNGSFENFTVNANHGRWKEVTFDAWEGKGEAWNNRLGKRSTKGAYKIELDVGRELNVLSQTVRTESRVEYELTLDAYARVANSSDFEIWIDDVKVESVTPSKEWKNYGFKFFGNGKAQKIQIKELASQSNSLGTVLDNISLLPTGKFDNRPPLIEGVAKKTVSLYNRYTFVPEASDVDGDNLTFSIENKPAWAEFNTATGVLSGTPTDIDTSANVKISVTDGKLSTSLESFSVEVTEAVDIAQPYGKATQPAKDGYYWYSSPDKMIDGDDTTYNCTEGTPTKNWVQIEVPNPTKIHKLMIQGRLSNAWRLGGATVYISDVPYNGTVDESQKIGTLKGNSTKQYIELSEAKSGTYLIIKGAGSNHIHLVTVEVYGEMPNAPKFTSSNYKTSTSRWMNKIESIFNVQATDYQNDSLSYSIEGDVPFNIDDNGDIRVTDVLTNDSYSFDVVVSDGIYSAKQSMSIAIENKTTVDKTFRINDSTPELSGFLPNIYNDGESVTVEINGTNYTATVNNGMWQIDDDTIAPALEAGLYDVKLIINGTEVLYANYFEVYAERMQSIKKSLVLNTIDDVSVNVVTSITTPLVKNEKVRGNSIKLYVENGITKLQNKSYRTIASLLGKYEDANGNSVFVKLNFSENIKPYSDNNLSSFAHDTEMKIVTTASHFNGEFSFGGADCTEATMDTTKYCTPTTRNDDIYSDRAVQDDAFSEQQLYSIALATYNHFYNSIDGLKAMRAWVEKSTYKDMDFTSDSQSINDYIGSEDKFSYLYRHFYNFTMPEHHVNMRAMRYKYAAQGMARLTPVIPLIGSQGTSGWASLWEGTIDLDGRSDYEFILHEIGHSYSNDHETGMTYGWAHAFREVVRSQYTVKEYPIVHVPKYIFETKYISNTQTKIIVHKTSDANEDEITFELLSSTPLLKNDLTISSDNDDNSVILNNKKSIITRLFVRVYGDDSKEIASQMIRPKEMYQSHLITFADKREIHVINHDDWQKTAKTLGIAFTPQNANLVCKAWFGVGSFPIYKYATDTINTKHRAEMDAVDWLTSKKFIINNYTANRRVVDFTDGAYSVVYIDKTKELSDDEYGLLCWGK